MVKHIVLWKICEGGTQEDREAVLKEFEKKIEYLKTIIPELKPETRVALSYVGDYHLCIDGYFDDEEAVMRYINHPEHLKVRAWLDTLQYGKTTFRYEV